MLYSIRMRVGFLVLIKKKTDKLINAYGDRGITPRYACTTACGHEMTKLITTFELDQCFVSVCNLSATELIVSRWRSLHKNYKNQTTPSIRPKKKNDTKYSIYNISIVCRNIKTK